MVDPLHDSLKVVSARIPKKTVQGNQKGTNKEVV